MRKHCIWILLFFLYPSCSSAPSNYKEALVVKRENQVFIKLQGKRVSMVHDIVGVFSNELHEDSILIPIPKLREGVIRGENIPVKKGYYKYTGTITINKNKLQVNLQIVNTDDHKVVPELWNGQYDLINE